MKRFDQAFGIFLLLGAAGQTAATFLLTPALSDSWVWSLGASLAGFLLGALNVMRAARPHDRTLAVIATVGTALWALIALAFGESIENLWDPRVVIDFVSSVVLVVFGLHTLLRARAITMRSAPSQASTISG